jgi:hypothetical protein
MQDSHTPAPADEAADCDRLRLVPATTLGLAERLGGRLDGHLVRFAEHLREGLLAASVAVGLEVMGELMESEVIDLAGPKGKHNPARTAKRHGSQDGTVTLGGRRVPVRRPRVRSVGDDEHELPLASYDGFTSAQDAFPCLQRGRRDPPVRSLGQPPPVDRRGGADGQVHG